VSAPEPVAPRAPADGARDASDAVDAARGAPGAPASRADRPLVGIALMLVFATMASWLDAVAKWFTQSYPVLELIWIRYATQTALLLALVPWLGVRRIVATRAPWLQLGRGAALFASASMFVAGLSLLPFATTKVLGYTSPLLVAAISAPLLGERVGWRRWLFIGLGFAGVVTVARPGFGALEWAMLLPLGTAATYAFYQIGTRRAAAIDPILPTLFWAAAGGFALASLALPFVWTPPTLAHAAILVVHASFVGLGHFVLVRALAVAPASLVAPFGYVSLIWAVLIGMLVFDEQPDSFTLAGGAMVALAGILLFRSAARGG
jgi:drug/metabolite transporter (DMT)-like permease